MIDLQTALVDAAHRPVAGPDMEAARRRARSLRRRRAGQAASVLAVIIVAASLGVVAVDRHQGLPRVSVANNGGLSTFANRVDGVQISYPADWNVASRDLTPQLTDPREVLALGTYRMTPTNHTCSHIPVNALEQLGPRDAFIWITERTGSDKLPASNFGTRPTSITPTSGTRVDPGSDLFGCLAHPLAATTRAISFDDHGRHFTITYAIGRDTSQRRRDNTMQILNSFTVAKTPSASPPQRVLFTRTSPNGITVTATAGLVPIAEATECPEVPAPLTTRPNVSCPNGTAPGIQFNYNAAGRTYRVTVLDRDTKYGRGQLRPMNTLATIRQVRADGSTVTVNRVPAELAVLYARELAEVRINPRRSVHAGRDEMTPVDGWIAFPAYSNAAAAFDNQVQGLNAQGNVVATALPYRCC